MKKYTFLTIAEDVLNETKQLMTITDIWNKAVEMHLDEKLGSQGKTPSATLGARLYVEIKENADKSDFVKYSKNPALFGLKSLNNLYDVENDAYQPVESTVNNKISYSELDLHQVLTNFVYSNEHFKCLVKTVNQANFNHGMKSKVKNLNEWVHPDLIGVYFPFEDYKNSIDVLSCLGEKAFKIYSFEMKKEVNTSNFKQYYFQAVSNSSWANEGYLVAANDMQADSELMKELNLLNNSFGIGVIQLNIHNPEQSEIILPARIKQNLDIDMLNKLIDLNKDVKVVFDNIKTSCSLNRCVETDKVFDKYKNEEEYLKYLKAKKM